MLFAVITLSSVFIPFSKTSQPFVPPVSEQQMWSIVNSTSMAAVLVEDSSSNSYKNDILLFAKASIIFADGGPFLFLEHEKAKSLMDIYKTNVPALFLFKNGKVWMHSAFTPLDTPLLFIMHQFFTQSLHTVDSLSQLLSVLGHFSFSLLAPKSLVTAALELRSKVAPFLGPADVIAISDDLIAPLKLKPGQIGIYRSEDSGIDSISADFDSFFIAAKPVFRKMVPSDLSDPNATVAAILANNITSEMEDMLYILAERHPNISVGYIDSQYLPIVFRATLMDLSKLPIFVAFNPVYRYFYPTNGYFSSKMQNSKFSAQSWFPYIDNYLADIESGALNFQYHTQDEKPSQKVAHFVVGKTYEEFIKDSDQDIFMLYTDPVSSQKGDAEEQVEAAAEALNDLGIHSIKFGIIDSLLNSAPTLFPPAYVSPYARFFPAHNRSESFPFPHEIKKDDILRFVARMATEKPQIDVPKKNADEFKGEVGGFVRIMYGMNEKDRNILTTYYRDMWLELDIKVGIETGESTTEEAFADEDLSIPENEL